MDNNQVIRERLSIAITALGDALVQLDYLRDQELINVKYYSNNVFAIKRALDQLKVEL